MIRLIIFDFDDTIIDNSFLDYNAFVTPCKQLKIKIPQQKEFIKLRKKGLVAKEIMIKILKKQNKEEMLSGYLELRTKFLFKESLKYLILKKNTKSLLNYWFLTKHPKPTEENSENCFQCQSQRFQ